MAEISWEDTIVSEPAKQIIKSLWLVQRKLHHVSVKNYITTISLAVAHAKLCKSNRAELCDAVIAIYAMEEYHCLNEQSILGFVVGKRNLDSYGNDFV